SCLPWASKGLCSWFFPLAPHNDVLEGAPPFAFCAKGGLLRSDATISLLCELCSLCELCVIFTFLLKPSTFDAQLSPLLPRHPLHLPESSAELPAGPLHRNFRINLQKPRQIHRRKQNIPHFPFNLFAPAFLQHLPQLFRLFLQLLEDPSNVLP